MLPIVGKCQMMVIEAHVCSWRYCSSLENTDGDDEEVKFSSPEFVAVSAISRKCNSDGVLFCVGTPPARLPRACESRADL